MTPAATVWATRSYCRSLKSVVTACEKPISLGVMGETNLPFFCQRRISRLPRKSPPACVIRSHASKFRAGIPIYLRRSAWGFRSSTRTANHWTRCSAGPIKPCIRPNKPGATASPSGNPGQVKLTSPPLPGRLIAIGGACLAAFTAGILGYAVLASTTRYMADDYWTAYIVKTTPFWQLPAYWYTHWSGRFSFFFLVSLAELAGVRIVPILPFLALLSLTCATTLLAWRWLRVLQLQHPLPTAFLTATLFVYCTIHSTPNVLQSLYWQTGMLTYFAPIGLFVAYLALVSRLAQCSLRGWRWLWLAISGLLVFVIGGFSETSIAIQVTALSLGLAICAFLFGRRHWLPWLGVGLAASLLALVVMILAPGHQIRLAGNTPHLDVGYVFTTSLKVGLGSLLGALRTYPCL